MTECYCDQSDLYLFMDSKYVTVFSRCQHLITQPYCTLSGLAYNYFVSFLSLQNKSLCALAAKGVDCEIRE